MENYCVYLHRRKDNNKVFYVGQGRLIRAYSKSSSKSKQWVAVEKEAGGHIVEIVKYNLNREEALAIEEFLITSPRPEWDLVNVHKTTATKEIPDWIGSKIAYSEDSPSCLIWKINSGKRKIGKTAGSFDPVSNRWYVNLGNKKYLCHRVVWFLFHGSCDTNLTINHIDTNSSNNRIENLELITQHENNRKKKCNVSGQSTRSVSGINGVSEMKLKGRNGKPDLLYAFVQWTTKEGFHKNKTFSYLKYGKENAWNLAIAFRRSLDSSDYLK